MHEVETPVAAPNRPSPPDEHPWDAFGWAPAGLAIAFIALFVLLALLRLPYPYALEWMESGAPAHVARVLAGQGLYVEPTLEFVPFLYTPLYYYVAAIPSLVLGVGLPALRLVSLLASLATIIAIGTFVGRLGGSRLAALVAAGLYAATFRLSGGWFDLARVDALFVFFLVAAAGVLGLAETSAGVFGAGALLGLAFMTKQTALLAAGPFVIAAVCRHGRRGWAFLAGFLAVAGLGIALFQATSGGWFGFYLYGLLGGHEIVRTAIFAFWTRDMLEPTAIAAALGLFALAVPPTRPGVSPNAMRGFLVALGLGFVGLSFAGRLNFGGYVNVLMPAFAYMALLGGLGVAEVTRALREAEAKPILRATFHGALCLQFAVLAYMPQRMVPSAADRAAGDALVADLKARPGEVWLPYHPDVLARAGKAEHAHAMALVEVAWSGGPVASSLDAALEKAFREKRFGTVVLNEQPLGSEAVKAALKANYKLEGPAATARNLTDFYPVTGLEARPTTVFTAR